MDQAPVWENVFKNLQKIHFVDTFLKLLLFFAFFLKYKVRNALTIEGKLKLRWNQPAILIGNHSSPHDFFVTMGTAARYWRMLRSPVSEQDWKDPLQKVFLKYLKMIPRMGNGEQIVEKMIKVLNEGDILTIGPEGTFSHGLVMQGYTGFLRAYFEINKDQYWVPFVPCFIKGIAQAYPSKTNFFTEHKCSRHVKITIILGEPFHIKRPKNLNRETLRKYTDYIMLKIAKMGGQKKLQPNFKLEKMHRDGLETRSYEIVDGLEGI